MIFLQRAGFEAAYQAATIGVTARAMGDDVSYVLAFDALREYLRGTYGLPHSDREQAEMARAEGLGVLAPMKMLEEARILGARFLACDSVVRICGLAEADLGGRIEVMGLPSIWKLAQVARTFSL